MPTCDFDGCMKKATSVIHPAFESVSSGRMLSYMSNNYCKEHFERVKATLVIPIHGEHSLDTKCKFCRKEER
jgi:hypothetical protein